MNKVLSFATICFLTSALFAKVTAPALPVREQLPDKIYIRI